MHVTGVYEAMRIEGTSKFSILCYGVFPVNDLESAFNALKSGAHGETSRVHRFHDHGWPKGFVLNEVIVEHQREVPRSVADALSRMFAPYSCLASACMLDGAFGSYADLFAPDLAPQTYAFCFSRNQPVLALDDNTVASSEWRLIIERARERLAM